MKTLLLKSHLVFLNRVLSSLRVFLRARYDHER